MLVRCRAALEAGRALRTLGLVRRRCASAARLSVSVGQAAAARRQPRRGGRRPSVDDVARLAGHSAMSERHGRGGDGRLREDRARDRVARIRPMRRRFSPISGLKQSGLDRIIRAAYELLGYISFFTVGEDECRAWSIPRATPAHLAAGAIHSDIQRGFIRAEVVALRSAARARLARRVPRSRRAAARGQGLSGRWTAT